MLKSHQIMFYFKFKIAILSSGLDDARRRYYYYVAAINLTTFFCSICHHHSPQVIFNDSFSDTILKAKTETETTSCYI
jgi:hypothetical protein